MRAHTGEVLDSVTSRAMNSSAGSNTTPLKIALLGYRSHPFVGGQGIYLKYLSRALRSLGHTVHVYSGQPYPELDADIELYKVPSLNLYESPNHIRALRWQHFRSFSDVYEWWAMATGGFGEPYTFGRRAFKQLKDSDYDIIHDNQSLCTGLLQLQKYGHTVVSTIHHPIQRDRELAVAEAPNSGMRFLVNRWYSFLKMQERVVPKLKFVTTVSKQSQTDIAHFFKRDAAQTPVIFNGVDTNLFRPLDHIEKETFTLITTSSSDQPLKGLATLIEAVHSLRQRFPHIKLRVVGELKENSSNDKLIKKFKLEKHIKFHSNISDQTLVELYNRSYLTICPSLYEGFGLPAAEAMACGATVISSDGGALPEVVGEAGIIFKAGDANALEQSITSLFNDADLHRQIGTKARERAEETFCWQRVAEQLSEFYHSILKSERDGNR